MDSRRVCVEIVVFVGTDLSARRTLQELLPELLHFRDADVMISVNDH